MPLCYACGHSQRELIDRFCRDRAIYLDDGSSIKSAKELSAHLEDNFPDEHAPSEVSLSKHKNNHIYAANVAALVYRDGSIMTTKGESIPKVSVIDYLDTVIAVAQWNILNSPEKVSPTQGNEAVGLKYKIQHGVTDEDEIKAAYANHLRDRAKRAKKVKQPEPIEGEYEVVD